MLRVTSGTMRGRRVPVPHGKSIRPIPEKIRLALGNMLSERLDGARVLDVFAGTGSFAIEALSRGAESAVLVELDRKHAAFIRRTTEKFGISDAARVVVFDAFKPEKYLRPTDAFDVIFLGPPYPLLEDPADRKKFENLASALFHKHLADGGVMLAQIHKNILLSTSGLNPPEERVYGINKILVFEKRNKKMSSGRIRNNLLPTLDF